MTYKWREFLKSSEWRLVGLQIITGLVVAFVRHDLERPRVAWDFVQFLISWFIHTIGVVVLVAFTIVPILWWHRFFLGYDYEGSKQTIEQTGFYIIMTVLVASVCIFVTAHYIPTEDYD